MIEQFGPWITVITVSIVFLLGAVLLSIRTLEYQNRPAGKRNPLELLFLCLGWPLVIFFFLCFGLLFCLLPFIVVYIFLQNMRMKQQGLLWMMALAAERSIPLTPAIEAFAREVGGIFGRAGRLAQLLSEGIPLPDALTLVPLLVSSRHYPVIRTAHECGALARGLREAAMAQDSQQGIWGSLAIKMFYIAGMIWVGGGILTFVMLRIVPSFEKIFKDFQTQLPPVTIALVSVSRWVVNFWYVSVPFFLVFFLLFCYSAMKYIGLAPFDLPGLGRLMRRKHSAAIMDALTLAIENRRPIDAAFATLARCYPNDSVRVKLALASADVQAGAAWDESLCRRELIMPSDLAVLQAAGRAGNLPWAMREMADSNRRRLAYRLNVLVQTLFPPVVLCFGAMVLFVVVALFKPLIILIIKLK